MVVIGLPAIGALLDDGTTVTSQTVVFRTGDVIQPANSRYPYTVISDVLRGGGSGVGVSTHRPLITSEGISVINVNCRAGNLVSWRMIVIGKPTYKIIPYNRIEWSGTFDLIERII
jgi:hypothetical protein